MNKRKRPKAYPTGGGKVSIRRKSIQRNPSGFGRVRPGLLYGGEDKTEEKDEGEYMTCSTHSAQKTANAKTGRNQSKLGDRTVGQ